MPDPVITPAVVPDPAAHNAEIARKLAAQDASGQSATPNDLDVRVATDALDKLAEQATKAGEDAAAKKAAEEAAANDKEAQAKAAKAAEEARQAEAAKKSADDQIQKRADALFKDAPALPSGAHPKSAEAFATIKQLAAKEVSEREARIEALEKELAAAKESVSKPNPEWVKKEEELKALQTWRASLDVDYDPKFREYDARIAQHHEFIYAQLKRSPSITDAHIAQIKKYGGPENVQLGKLFEAINDPTLQRIVESKVADIEQIKFNKDQAIKAAKENFDTYQATRQKELQGQRIANITAVATETDKLLSALDWFKEKQPSANATDAEKADVADHNKFVSELRGQLQESIKDDSPMMRATLLLGTAQLFNLQRAHAKLVAEHEAAKKSLAELTEKYERVKSSGMSRLRESAAPPSGQMPAKPPPLIQPAGDALDALMKQVVEKRQAEGARA